MCASIVELGDCHCPVATRMAASTMMMTMVRMRFGKSESYRNSDLRKDAVRAASKRRGEPEEPALAAVLTCVGRAGPQPHRQSRRSHRHRDRWGQLHAAAPVELHSDRARLVEFAKSRSSAGIAPLLLYLLLEV